MKLFENYIRSRLASGKYYFTKSEALAELSISENALRCGVYKLKKKGDVISPVHGLYIIIPSEYRRRGFLPAEEITPILFGYLKVEYYVCLLSAALYYGAAHQKPQVWQVVTEKRLKPITIKEVLRFEFIHKKSISNLPLQKHVVKTGYLNISTPELTAMDLLLYPHHSGGVSHIATVLTELIESIDTKKLVELIDISAETFWIQRFGYILERLDPLEVEKRDELVEAVYKKIEKRLIYPVPLSPKLSVKGASRDNRWKIIENTTIESDI